MRITLDIRDNINPIIALECVKEVIKIGRVSNNGKMYSYATTFITKYGEIGVYTREYRKSDCFLICKIKHNNIKQL